MSKWSYTKSANRTTKYLRYNKRNRIVLKATSKQLEYLKHLLGRPLRGYELRYTKAKAYKAIQEAISRKEMAKTSTNTSNGWV
jgi:hypothetical protein